jgi:thiamine biosynthesis lipoprotein
MRVKRDIMGMPVTIDIVGGNEDIMDTVFSYYRDVDERFSTYKAGSEISRINCGELSKEESSDAMREVFSLAEETKQATAGYFDIICPNGTCDPSGIVKGWAIRNAARLVERLGYANYFLEVGGDIQSAGVDVNGAPWTIGIRNPLSHTQIVKVLRPEGRGVATSGTYLRGQHIYNPHSRGCALDEVVSLTVVGPDVYEADRFATAAFAMGTQGINFIESLPGFEGYQIDPRGVATMTSGFKALTV